MNKKKTLLILVGVLVVVTVLAIAATMSQHKQEQISESGEAVFQLDTDKVTTLSWDNDGKTLSFHKDGDQWVYDSDASFPVSEASINQMLSVFKDFTAAYTISDVDDYGQYGLDKPKCTINIGTDSDSYCIKIGDYSQMDSQRYVSLTDGTVVLAVTDPLDTFNVGLEGVIQTDAVPDLVDYTCVKTITFKGNADYTITYEKDSPRAISDKDVFFTDEGVLSTSKVKTWLDKLSVLTLGDYVTYQATDDDLAKCGLDNPTTTATVNYTDPDGNDATFTISFSADQDALAKAKETEETSDDEAVDCYARIGDSSIIYKIDYSSYQPLTAVTYNDLRSSTLFTASTDDITSIDVELSGDTYSLTREGSGDSAKWSCGDKSDIDMTSIKDALTAVTADSFVTEGDTSKLELGLTVKLDNANSTETKLQFYRYDGSDCLAVVNGTPTALVPRSQVVDLTEAINEVVL